MMIEAQPLRENVMTTARQMMHNGVECVTATETLDRAAQMMRDMQVGSLPICGPDNKLKGILTDRDIVVNCIAHGKDPSKMTAGELATGQLIWVDAKADEDEVHNLVGMISEADLAQHLDDAKLHHFVSTITAAPPSPVLTKAKASSGRKSKTK
jgi:CBS domain-containing protein